MRNFDIDAAPEAVEAPFAALSHLLKFKLDAQCSYGCLHALWWGLRYYASQLKNTNDHKTLTEKVKKRTSRVEAMWRLSTRTRAKFPDLVQGWATVHGDYAAAVVVLSTVKVEGVKLIDAAYRPPQYLTYGDIGDKAANDKAVKAAYRVLNRQMHLEECEAARQARLRRRRTAAATDAHQDRWVQARRRLQRGMPQCHTTLARGSSRIIFLADGYDRALESKHTPGRYQRLFHNLDNSWDNVASNYEEHRTL